MKPWKVGNINDPSLSDRLIKAESAINNGKYGTLHSLLIIKGNELIYEKYFNGWKQDSAHQLQSATKSVISTLLGIAIKQGFIKNIDEKVLSFYSKKNIQNIDKRKEMITIEDLLTQRHGLEWIEAPWNSPKNTWRKVLATEGDWYEMILSTPMREEPGTNMNYGNAAPVLISGIIQQASGMEIDDFAKKYLFDPLGITNYRFWQGNGKPANNGAALLFLTARDLAKIGQLYLQNGSWNGQQLLPYNWVKEAAQTPIISDIRDNSFYRFGYGYFWWNTPHATGANLKSANTIYAARGAGGQYLIVHPDENMVVVINAWDLRTANYIFELFTKYIQSDKYLRQSLHPKKFAEEILTKNVESSLTITPDGKTIYFAKKDSFYVSGQLSTIYTSYLQNGSWTTPVIASFSGHQPDTGPFITPDGSKLFFTSRRPTFKGEEKEDADIWYLEKTGASWGEPKHLSIYNSDQSEYSPSTDIHGNLYFGSYREGGRGSGDIWVSYFKDGKYQDPVNLGEAINTQGGEWGSCISPDGDYLIYEASDRHANITNNGDLFISFKKDGSWSESIHLGELNSGGSDLSPRIHGDNLYFASNRHEDFLVEFTNNNVELYTINIDILLNYVDRLQQSSLQEPTDD